MLADENFNIENSNNDEYPNGLNIKEYAFLLIKQQVWRAKKLAAKNNAIKNNLLHD